MSFFPEMISTATYLQKNPKLYTHLTQKKKKKKIVLVVISLTNIINNSYLQKDKTEKERRKLVSLQHTE